MPEFQYEFYFPEPFTEAGKEASLKKWKTPRKREKNINKNLIELACSVRTGKILVSFQFCKFMDGALMNLQKKENIFPVRTSR